MAVGPGETAHFGGAQATFDDGTGPAIYAQYGAASSPFRAGMARWRGQVWERMDQGLPPLSFVDSVRVLDDGIGSHPYFVGGLPPMSGCWYWGGAAWLASPTGFFSADTQTQGYCSFNDGTGTAIYGTCRDSTGLASFGRWDGQQWHILTSLGFFEPYVIQALDRGDGPAIYVGGSALVAGSTAFNGISKWDGSQWSPLGAGFGNRHDCRAMVVFDSGEGPELFVGGDFDGGAEIPTVHGLARWNGQRWAAVPGHGGAAVRSLAVFDDGSGPALFVAGDFTSEGGIAANHIAKWNGHSWFALGAGVGANSADLLPFPTDPRGPSLIVWTSGAGNVGGGSLGGGDYEWVGCPNCYANCDTSTQVPRLNVLDFICFLNKYAARDPYANCTVDATIDVNDFQCFLNKFAAGCT